MTPARRERLLAFTVIGALFALTLFPEFGYVPIWDGRVYADCAIDAAANGISFAGLRCAGHPSQGYAIWLALSQLVRPGDVSLLHLTNTLLGLGALASIRVALARVFPAPALARELDLVLLACAIHPVLLSTLVQVNIDFGVYVFFFASLAALLSGRFRWAAFAGLLLCFSKETGVLAYGVMAGLYALFTLLEGAATVPARLRRLVPLSVLAAPLVAFGVHVLWWNATHTERALWKQGWQRGALDGFKFFDFSDPVFVSYAAGIFVVGFMWVVTALVGTDLLVGGVRMARRRPDREVPGADRRLLAYVGVLTALLTWVLTAFRTWSNLRYFALLYPLVVLLAFAALLRLRAGPRARVPVLALVTVLFALATFRSVDPVSRLVYGTFDVGERSMYTMASITGEFDGPGRDELVYNLEFTGFAEIQNALYRRLRPTGQTLIVTSRTVRWNIWAPLDGVTFRRSLARRNAFSPDYQDDLTLAAMTTRPPELWFLEFSNRGYHDTALSALDASYREDAIVRVRARGHVLRAHHLVRREAQVLP